MNMEGDLSTSAETVVSEQSLWDKMLLEERKIEAEKRGLRVCDIEEETSLTLALEESVIKKNRDRGAKPQLEDSNLSQQNEQIKSASSVTDDTIVSIRSKRVLALSGSVVKDLDDRKITGDNDDDGQFQDEIIKCQMPLKTIPSQSTEILSTVTDDTPLQELSIWQLSLPHDLGMKVLDFLQDIDMCGYLNQIAKTNCFRPTEAVYKTLCEYIYTAQSKKKKLIVENWKSWRNMLVFRPRIRTNGFYCLRTLYSRAPSNDSFWEEKITQSVEVKFYRHMRFFDNGRMLYSLDTVEPDDMAKHLVLGSEVPKKIFEGKYTLIGKQVHVEVVMHYAVVHFELIILDGQDGYIGKHNTLRMIEHASAAIYRGAPGGAYWGTEKVNHKLPNNTDLQFWRHWSWNSAHEVKTSAPRITRLPE